MQHTTLGPVQQYLHIPTDLGILLTAVLENEFTIRVYVFALRAYHEKYRDT